MKEYKRLSTPKSKDIEEFLSFIANNPTADSEQLMRKSLEMGFSPREMIDLSLGAVKYEKSKANLDKPIVDILNDIYEDDPTPGRRYVIEPSEAISKKAKEISENLGGNIGIAASLDIGRPRQLPDYSVVKEAYGENEKLKRIADAGHELQHQKDALIRPGFIMKDDRPYKKGHHYGDIYETSELLREAKDLPKDEKVVKEILKRSKSSGLKPSAFTKLRSLLGPLATGAALYSALESKDVPAAVLSGASLVDPTGISDAALEVKRRLDLKPEERMKQVEEDLLLGMPPEVADEQKLFRKLKEKVK